DSEVCLLRGATREEVIALGRQVLVVLTRTPTPSLAAVAKALNTHSGTGPVTLGIVAHDIEDLTRKLDRALARLPNPACHKIKETSGIYFFDAPLGVAGKLAFLFPGEGSQYVNMLADLCRHFPLVRRCFDQIDRIFANHPRGYVLSDFLYPPPAKG